VDTGGKVRGPRTRREWMRESRQSKFRGYRPFKRTYYRPGT